MGAAKGTHADLYLDGVEEVSPEVLAGQGEGMGVEPVPEELFGFCPLCEEPVVESESFMQPMAMTGRSGSALGSPLRVLGVVLGPCGHGVSVFVVGPLPPPDPDDVEP